VPFDVAKFTVVVPDVSPVRLRVIAAVCDSSSVNVAEVNCTEAADGVPVEVGVAVAVFVAVGVGVNDGVADGDWHAPLNTSENARAEPVSPPALSLMLITQLPLPLTPLSALSGLFGENVPVGNAAFVSAPHWFSNGSAAPSASSSCARLLLGHPNVDAGTPGRSYAITDVPPGAVILTAISPTHEWFIPGVVDVGSALCVPSNLNCRPDTVVTPLTGIVKFTPAAMLSGIAVAGPV